MVRYLITVQIETSGGEICESCQVRFFNTKDSADNYAAGFADGYAIAFEGAVVTQDCIEIKEGREIYVK